MYVCTSPVSYCSELVCNSEIHCKIVQVLLVKGHWVEAQEGQCKTQWSVHTQDHTFVHMRPQPLLRCNLSMVVV